MLSLFRKLRKRNMERTRYIKYAIGEIALVVVGILIALSINNWNDGRKAGIKKQGYAASLIAELELDLAQLDVLDSMNHIYIQTLENYIDYYNKTDKSIDSLVARLKGIRSTKSFFNTQAFTIDDLLSTGNLSLFDPEIRKGIIRLKQTQEINAEYERKSAENLVQYERAAGMAMDLFFENYGEVPEHPDARGWKREVNSSIFRLHNNKVIEANGFHRYQLEVHERIRVKTKALIEQLKSKFA